jgi:hypothetical protein
MFQPWAVVTTEPRDTPLAAILIEPDPFVIEMPVPAVSVA